MINTQSLIILASNSRARNEMLRNVGLDFTKISADINEAAIIQNAQSSPEKLAELLACQKALQISESNPNHLVIGSDQILEMNGRIFQKANHKDEARDKLKALRGKTHHLISAVSIAKNNEIIWQHMDIAKMTMHDFDDAFLEHYLDNADDDILSCVGAYAFESHGAWLFKKTDANYFTILGMPLLPLLEFLKEGGHCE